MELSAVKGDTRKTVVELKVKGKEIVSEASKFYMNGKNQKVDIIIPIKLKKDCGYETGAYNLIIDGIDVHEEKEIVISAVPCADLSESHEYELISSFCREDYCTETIKISNNEDMQHEYEINSYVYDGPKVYSGERETNLQLVSLEPHATKYISLENKFTVIPDEAKIKIRIQRDDKKTPREFTENITIEKRTEETNEVFSDQYLILTNSPEKTSQEPEKTNGSKITGRVVYRSASEKTKDLSKYLVIACVLFGVYILISQMKK